MGQETLAKVFNLGATRRRLAGLALSAPAQPGAPVMLGALCLVHCSLTGASLSWSPARLPLSAPAQPGDCVVLGALCLVHCSR